MPERTIILDRQGTEIGRIHGEKRSIVPLKDVSEDFRKAILARENERFYSHGAIDVLGIGRASLKNLEGKKEGASTITQQLASDVFQLKAREMVEENRSQPLKLLMMQLDRKCLEIAIAFRLESALSKDRILEAYINQINWGRQAPLGADPFRIRAAGRNRPRPRRLQPFPLHGGRRARAQHHARPHGQDG
jgi:penicillin-binding protein 1A